MRAATPTSRKPSTTTMTHPPVPPPPGTAARVRYLGRSASSQASGGRTGPVEGIQCSACATVAGRRTPRPGGSRLANGGDLCWGASMSMLDDPGLFGRQWAASYDGPGIPDPGRAVEFLAGLAAGGPALELAIGTGRVALPLAARGIAVEGIEASPEMVALLRAKPGGADLPVVIGDMADVGVTGPYPLVFLVFNTLFNLTG